MIAIYPRRYSPSRHPYGALCFNYFSVVSCKHYWKAGRRKPDALARIRYRSLAWETRESSRPFRQAVEIARRSDEGETAALWQANAAIREALFGNTEEARKSAAGAVTLAAGSRDAEAQAALAYALAGD
jgi:hypothetical protein